MLTLRPEHYDAMVATAIRALPNEGCGLLVGDAEGKVSRIVPSHNVADSAKIYEIDPKVLLRTFREADDAGENGIRCKSPVLAALRIGQTFPGVSGGKKHRLHEVPCLDGF